MDLIVHYISKSKDSSNTTLTESSSLVGWGAGVNQSDLFNELVKLFNAKGKMYGKFVSNSKFEADYLSHNSPNFDLIKFSQDSVKHLETVMSNTQFATGGFVWYLTYDDASKNKHLMVLVLNNADGFALELKNGSYEIGNNQQLDLKHLRMGVDINLTDYTTNSQDKYLQFKSGSSRETSVYFYNNYVEAENVYSSRKASTDLMKWLGNLSGDIASKTNKDIYKVKSQFDEFLDGKASVTLNELAELFFPGDQVNQDDFIQNANNNSISEETELDPSIVKRYAQKRVRPKGTGVDLKFSATDVTKGSVVLNQQENSIIVNNIEDEIFQLLGEL